MNRTAFIRVMIYLLIILYNVGCTENYDGIKPPIQKSTSTPPKPEVIKVIPKMGALLIEFTFQEVENSVEQVIGYYYNTEGIKRQFSVSKYTSEILIEGLIGTMEVPIILKSIDKYGNHSDSTEIKAIPKESPLEKAFNSLKVEPSFGGCKIEWSNPSGSLLAFHILIEDSIDKYETILEEDLEKTFYTSDSLKNHQYIRQFENRNQQIGIVISDKWNNRTDTLITKFTPYKEERIDYTNISLITAFNPTLHSGNLDYDKHGIDVNTGIQNDGNCHGESYGHLTIFDNIRTGQQYYIYKFIKNFDDGDPSTNEMIHEVYSTYDLNSNIKLSRIKLYQRSHYTYHYNRSSPKRFRLWGTNDFNNERYNKFPENWTLIGEYEGIEPENIDNLTDEEVEYFLEDNEFLIDDDNVSPDANPNFEFRYLRIEWLETYNKNDAYYTLNELELFGESTP